MNFESLFQECPVVAILRGITPAEVAPVCDALLENGIRLLEIPLNTPGALECISIASKHVEGKQLAGAGTVLTPEDVDHVAAAGGKFIISPNTNPAVIRRTVELGLISMPGFFTPSEAFVAMEAGAHYLKLFPAGDLGPGYIKNIKAVVKKPIVAVGGVDAENIPDFMKVCIGVGIGGALYKPGKSLDAIRRDAAAMVASCKK